MVSAKRPRRRGHYHRCDRKGAGRYSVKPGKYGLFTKFKGFGREVMMHTSADDVASLVDYRGYLKPASVLHCFIARSVKIPEYEAAQW